VFDLAIFWLSVGTLVWVYVGYPVFVGALARVAPLRLRADGPPVTICVAIAVHDEAGQIVERIADAMAQGRSGVAIAEIIVGSDGSTDGTDELVRTATRNDPRIRLLTLPRGGQTTTQNALFAAATADIVVLTDAETRFSPGCLAELAEPFRDSRVGCATGRLEWRNEGATATSANEGLYWQYERLVRGFESRAGVLTAVTGALLAVRRLTWRPVPSTASMDHLVPLHVRELGGLVVYVGTAVATDRPISGLREQFRNRSRTATRGIRANLSMVGRFPPWRRPRVAIAIWSHKLLRWATPWLVVVAGVSGLVAAFDGAPVYAFAPGLIASGLVAAAIAHIVIASGHRPPRAAAFARSFAVVSLAFAAGWINVVRGRRIDVWHRAEWDAEARPRQS
jgi:cellulose synthase/poly-beta-1,6-N-acetylglucosamine synthase-like glycosyltransferase